MSRLAALDDTFPVGKHKVVQMIAQNIDLFHIHMHALRTIYT